MPQPAPGTTRGSGTGRRHGHSDLCGGRRVRPARASPAGVGRAPMRDPVPGGQRRPRRGGEPECEKGPNTWTVRTHSGARRRVGPGVSGPGAPGRGRSGHCCRRRWHYRCCCPAAPCPRRTPARVRMRPRQRQRPSAGPIRRRRRRPPPSSRCRRPRRAISQWRLSRGFPAALSDAPVGEGSRGWAALGRHGGPGTAMPPVDRRQDDPRGQGEGSHENGGNLRLKQTSDYEAPY